MPELKPTRCIDPVMKFCQDCKYGHNINPAWVETAEDLEGCVFETACIYGFDKGRPEDEPTEEELKEFENWYRMVDNGKNKCKWEQDEFCVNADCPYCADFCPCSEFQEICKYYEAEFKFFTDKQNKLVHCEGCHEKCKFDKLK